MPSLHGTQRRETRALPDIGSRREGCGSTGQCLPRKSLPNLWVRIDDLVKASSKNLEHARSLDHRNVEADLDDLLQKVITRHAQHLTDMLGDDLAITEEEVDDIRQVDVGPNNLEQLHRFLRG